MLAILITRYVLSKKDILKTVIMKLLSIGVLVLESKVLNLHTSDQDFLHLKTLKSL